MRIARLALLSLVPIFLVSACIVAIGPGVRHGWGFTGRHGSGVKATQSREVGEFHALRIEGSCDAKVTVGGERAVVIAADDNLIDDVTTEVKDGVLVIAMKDGANDWFRVGPDAAIRVPALDGVTIEGSGDVAVTGVDGESFVAQISGSGDLKAGGRATRLKAAIEGSGDMNLAALEAQEADVSIEGSGDVRLCCKSALTASVSGSGDILYSGAPAKTSVAINGSGDIRPVK